MERHIPRCSEFPNDNRNLHEGSLWMCMELGAAARCELPVIETAVPLDYATAVDDIEIVDELSLDGVVDELALDGEIANEGAIAEVRLEAQPEEPVLEEPGTEEPEAQDAFAALVEVLEEAARTSGADDSAVARLRFLMGQSRTDGGAAPPGVVDALGSAGIATHSASGLSRAPAFTAVVLGWQGILRGETEDYGPCGAAPLDEWAADLVARCLGNRGMAPTIRRELRTRGVAAFGLANAA